ncbi:MAG: hypothetical protein QNK23_00940 [Crocinitomicaceae bacterium]|nr:hypothetical protein [Crocinitomicaceae bacterium]
MTDEQQDAAWENAIIVDGYNKDLVRKDICGAWMEKDKYKDADSSFGWHVDHIRPQAGNEDYASIDGHDYMDDDLNLQAMQIVNNGMGGKGNKYPTFDSAIQGSGKSNIESVEEFTISQEKQDELEELFK